MTIINALRRRMFNLGNIFHAAAQQHPELPIYLDHLLACSASDESELTLRQAVELVDKLTTGIHASGVTPHLPVMVWHRDGFDLPLIASAVARVGGVPAMLSPHLPLDTVLELFTKLNTTVVIADIETAAQLDPLLPAGTQLLMTDKSAGIVPVRSAGPELNGTLQALRSRPFRPGPDDPILITHTSGTTRLPKLAVHSGRSLRYRVLPQQMISVLLSRSVPALMSVTLVHTRFYGALAMLFWRGKPLIVARDPEVDSIANLLCKHRPDFLETHPNTFIDWEVLAKDARKPLASVKVLHAAFDAIHPRTMRIFLDASKHRNARFFRFYGQSEVGPSTGQWYSKRTVRSSIGQVVGWAIPGFISVRIVDGTGNKLGRNRTGHIWVRSRSRILGYMGDEEAFSRNKHGRWWDTGDMGSVDKLGRLQLADREIDQIQGLTSSLHYEDVLMEEFAAVREAIILEKDGHPVVLVSIQDGHGFDVQQLDLLASRVPGISAAYVVKHEIFPETATRKVQRPKLSRTISSPELFDHYVLAQINT